MAEDGLSEKALRSAAGTACLDETIEGFSAGYDTFVGERGVTLSGGEPFCQPLPCAEIARQAHAHGLNVWSYSGYTFEQLLEGTEEQKALLRELDVLVDGRFELDKRSLELRFRGSSNQRVIDVPQSLAQGRVIEKEI